MPPLDGSPAVRTGGRSGASSRTRYALFRGTPSKLWLDHTLQEVFGVDGAARRRERRRRLRRDLGPPAAAGLPAPCALRALRHRVPRHDRRCPRPAGVARAPPPIRLGGPRRAHLPPGRRRRPRPGRLPRERRDTGRAHRERTRTSWAGYLDALRSRRAAFVAAGATASDHGHPSPATADLSPREAEDLFGRVVAGTGAAGRRRAVPRPDAGRNGRHEHGRRPGAADPRRRVARPQPDGGGPLRPGQGRRHPDGGGLRGRPQAAARPVRQRAAA